MINEVYRLIAAKQIQVDFVDEIIRDEVIIRPTYLSICAADQRYYTGKRGLQAMKTKLPMALIHEGVGEVLCDNKHEFAVGTKVVMIPNTPMEAKPGIRENYLRSSRFRASGYDGFMQSFVAVRRDRIIPYSGIDDRIAVMSELLSVAFNAVHEFQHTANENKTAIGIWGNGSLGFLTALVLRKTYPNAKIYVMGTRQEKSDYFSFVDETYSVYHLPADLKIDHAFECVGGTGSEDAINQIIDIIEPQGTISLMGVSENKIAVNTRMILEKGLTLIGNSRSGYEDFHHAIQFMNRYEDVCHYIESIISREIVVHDLQDIHYAFDEDLKNDFKTIMRWEI